MSKRNDIGRGFLTNRRAFLSSVGVAGSSVLLTGHSRAGAGEKVELVVTKRGEKPVRTKRVSRDWWNQFNNARDKAQSLANTFLDDDRVADVRLETTNSWIGDHKQGKVAVLTQPNAEWPTLPNVLPDVPTEVREHNPKGKPLDGCNLGVDDPTSGGWQINDEDGGGSWWSTGCQVTHEGTGEPHMGTCAHSFDPCSTSSLNNPVYMNSTKVGKNVFLSESMDFSTIYQTDDSEISGFSPDIERPDKSPNQLDILGHITESGVADIMASEETVLKTGASGCTDTGVVDQMYVSDGLCQDGDHVEATHYVHATMETPGGDSGAPYYVKRWDNDFNKYFAEIVVAAHKGYESQGISAYFVYNETDYRFP